MNTINNALKKLNITITESQNQINAQTSIPKDFPAFDGHFPTNKILPGVSTLQLIVNIMDRTLNKSFYINEIIKSQFKTPIFPDEPIDIHIDYTKNENNMLKVKSIVKSNEIIKIICQIILNFKRNYSVEEK